MVSIDARVVRCPGLTQIAVLPEPSARPVLGGVDVTGVRALMNRSGNAEEKEDDETVEDISIVGLSPLCLTSGPAFKTMPMSSHDHRIATDGLTPSWFLEWQGTLRFQA